MQILRKIWAIFLDLIETFVIAGAVFVVIYAFLFRPFQVNGQSMLPNYSDGEYVLTNLVILHLEPLKRGDVIVFKAPPNQEKDFIKRIIGLPGESIIIENGKVNIDRNILDEGIYLSENVETYGGSFIAEGTEVIIPAGQYFVLGDNRSSSSDSREWGFVPRDKIIGKSSIVYWPPSRFRVVPAVEY